MTARILVGDCRELLATLDVESVDAVVCDPPYHLTTGKKGGSGDASDNPNSPAGRARVGTGFMGKTWDGGDVAFRPETWAAVLRVAKPGAFLVAFGGTRTYHRLTCAIEDAGWEIRDCLSWLYGSGFPKSLNLRDGRGTALKPAWEPIILARKPLIGTVAANVTEHGTGALNIDACRLTPLTDDEIARSGKSGGIFGQASSAGVDWKRNGRDGEASADRRYAEHGGTDFAASPGPRGGDARGRWPANVVLDEAAAAMLDEQTGELTSGAWNGERNRPKTDAVFGAFNLADEPGTVGDTGGASRFFYTAKASRSERNAGLDGLPEKQSGMVSNTSGQHMTRRDGGAPKPAANHHPTVKPLDLLRWLVKLITPPGGVLLDCFAGSGSTGCAAELEGFDSILMEREPEYAEIIRARVAHARAQYQPTLDLGGVA